MVEQLTAKLPNAMTKGELIDGGMSADDAELEMHKRVFGHNAIFDHAGEPIERGAGSPEYEKKLKAKGVKKSPHDRALELEESRKALTGVGQADVIAKAVAAGVQAGLKAGREEL